MLPTAGFSISYAVYILVRDANRRCQTSQRSATLNVLQRLSNSVMCKKLYKFYVSFSYVIYVVSNVIYIYIYFFLRSMCSFL